MNKNLIPFDKSPQSNFNVNKQNYRITHFELNLNTKTCSCMVHLIAISGWVIMTFRSRLLGNKYARLTGLRL